MKLADKSLSPPGGWKYTQPETGVLFTGVTYLQMRDKVFRHRRSNGLDVDPGWVERFEEDFCEQNRLVGTQWCPIEGATPKAERHLGVADIRRFLNTAREAIASGGDVFVEQEEADRRAAICAACVNNAEIPGCFGCNGLRKLISKVRGSRTTASEDKLRHCTVCYCTNSVKVWLKEEVIDSTGLQFPPHCWLAHSPETAQEHQQLSEEPKSDPQDQ